jgi:TRAP-type C4-dicarboxylate transport system permease large subunit
MILVIMASAALFSQLLSMTGALGAVTQAVADAGLSSWLMLAIMLILPFILCMFLDQIALMLVVIPIFAPLVVLLGFDPIWFWILFLINITVGGITPPFGYTMFVLKATAPHLELGDIYRAAWPFVGLYALGVVFLILFPDIVTVLPNMM